MSVLEGNGEFDAVFCFGNSFGYLDDAGNAAFLAAVGKALKPGGRFAIDYGQTAESIFPRLEARQEADMAGFHFAEETRYDMLSGRIENRFTFSRGGRTETKLASQRVYTVNEIVRLLAGAGLETTAFFGSPAEEPFVLGSHRLLIVATKGPSPLPTARGFPLTRVAFGGLPPGEGVLKVFPSDHRLITAHALSSTESPRLFASIAKYARMAEPTKFSAR